MKILFFTRYTKKGASSRYRFYQYFPYLKKYGVELTVSPLLDDNYLENLYSGKAISKQYLIKRFLRRLRYLFKADKYDLVVVEKELFPNLPFIFEVFLYFINNNIVVDYDDAIFVNYQNKKLLKNKISKIIMLSKKVSVGNLYLLDYARKFNLNVTLVPTVVNFSKYKSKNKYRKNNNKLIIGWIGTPITAVYLLAFKEVFIELFKRYNFILKSIGLPKNFTIEEINMENVEWQESTEVENLLSFDIGIMPLTEDPFSKGKCGLKLIQYMACGIPSIGSPIGINKEIIRDGINGFLAGSKKEWIAKISLMADNIKMRKKMGKRARQTAKKRYSLHSTVPKLVKVFTLL